MSRFSLSTKAVFDLPAIRLQHLLDSGYGAKYHALRHPHQTPAPCGFDYLRIQEVRQRQPARLGVWPFVLAPWLLPPVFIVCQQRRRLLLEAIGEE